MHLVSLRNKTRVTNENKQQGKNKGKEEMIVGSTKDTGKRKKVNNVGSTHNGAYVSFSADMKRRSSQVRGVWMASMFRSLFRFHLGWNLEGKVLCSELCALLCRACHLRKYTKISLN